MLVVGSGGNMIKEELDKKKIAELVRDIRSELTSLNIVVENFYEADAVMSVSGQIW